MSESAAIVGLVGLFIQWASSVMLVLLFLQLPRLSSRRQLIWTWAGAFGAKALADTRPAYDVVLGLLHVVSMPNVFTAFLRFSYWPAEFLFVALVAIGIFDFAGRRISSVARWRTIAGVAMLGAFIGTMQADDFGRQLEVLATPVLLFGSIQFLIHEARGPRRRGLLILSAAMTLFATNAVVLELGVFGVAQRLRFDSFVGAYLRLQFYVDTLLLLLLGSAVIILLVQDALLDAERERNERVHALATSEERLRRVISGAGEAIVTVGASGEIELANPAFDAMFESSPGSLLGRNIGDLVDAADALVAGSKGASGPLAGPPYVTIGRRPGGSSFPVEVTTGSLHVDGARGTVAIMRDLTQQRETEREREAFERRMAEAEKMLAIGRVVSGVAHELNNPLAVVLGQSEQLYESARDPESRSGLRMINEQAQRARHIVKDLLAFARRRGDVREPVNMAASARRVASSQGSQSADQQVTLLTKLPERLPPVVADPVAIEQILVNLIDNAIDAAGPGGTVTISGRGANGRSEILVEDSGRGIADEMVARIFEPFFTTKPTGQGTGLGLSVSTGLAEQHGGTLRVENRPGPGIGARFILSIPIDPDAMAAVPTNRKTATLPAPPRRDDGSAAEAMLIDDEAAVRATLARIFQRGGWLLRESATGEEALAWLLTVPAERSPAVILCDLKMPGVSGREVYSKLVESRPDLAPRVIFVTGDVVEQSTASFLASAGREVVEKPFTVAEIALAVQKVVTAG